MKLETKLNDLRALLARDDAAAAARYERNNATRALDALISGSSLPLIDPVTLSSAQRARISADAAAAKFAALPKLRRELAVATRKQALALGEDAAKLGGDYSGETDYGASFGAAPAAWTSTERGEQYSRSCKYSKLNASHRVTLDPAGVIALAESPQIVAASRRDGLRLIDLRADGSACWVVSKAKQIAMQRGWIAGDGSLCFHSTKSRADAQAGLAKKIVIRDRQAAQAAERARIEALDPVARAKHERRIRLIARLCSNVKASVKDARNMGFCTPGIEQFKNRFGVSGNSAPLPVLIRSGDPSAVRLALHIARTVRRQPAKITA